MKKNKSLLLSGPYILWMLAFTLIPLCVVLYYALTDVETGKFTLDNMQQLVQYLKIQLLNSGVKYLMVLYLEKQR